MKRRATALALAAAALTATGAIAQQSAPAPNGTSEEQQAMQQHPYVGMWVTADGQIRQELLPNGRYDEARGTRQSAYQGRYEIEGNMILYWDDTGFTADGEFISDTELHHGGMIFFRRNQETADDCIESCNRNGVLAGNRRGHRRAPGRRWLRGYHQLIGNEARAVALADGIKGRVGSHRREGRRQ